MNKFPIAVHDDHATIDLSPMLDVVFIMLIFFIVVASFVQESGLSANLPPPSSTPQPPSEDVIRITVEKGGSYSVNGRTVTAGGVRSYVRALYADNPKVTTTVFLERGSLVRDAALAMDAVHSIGVEVVPIVALD